MPKGDPMIMAFKELRAIHRMFDEAERQLSAFIGLPLCVPNCGRCCQINTPQVTTIEAILAVSYLTGAGQLSKMAGIAGGWLLDRDGLALYEGMPIGWAKPKLRDEWLAVAQSQCPFLGQDMRCQLYMGRPLACRACGVTRIIGLCPRPLGRNESLPQKMIADGTPVREAINKFRAWCRRENRAWIISGHVPTMLYRVARPEKFKGLVAGNRVPSAKLVGVELDTNLMWQPQVDALRQGMPPDTVAHLEEMQQLAAARQGG